LGQFVILSAVEGSLTAPRITNSADVCALPRFATAKRLLLHDGLQAQAPSA
jgi:hypothetical protein